MYFKTVLKLISVLMITGCSGNYVSGNATNSHTVGGNISVETNANLNKGSEVDQKEDEGVKE